MKKRRLPTNPEVYKTYNPNWEPWATFEEYLSFFLDRLPHN